jgi:hypothetical protein
MASYYKRGDYQWEARIRRKGYPMQARTFDTGRGPCLGGAGRGEMQRGSYIVRNEADRTTMKELIERFIREVTPSHRGQVKRPPAFATPPSTSCGRPTSPT